MQKPEDGRLRMNRREFLRLSSGAMIGVAAGTFSSLPVFSLPYVVGLGHHPDPYQATLQAISYTTWNPAQIAGKNVFIKPNLVKPDSGESGVITDPQVTRAVVDLCIAAGAANIVITETSFFGAYFNSCGYAFFNNYHPSVSLVDTADFPFSLMPVAGGLAFHALYLPDFLQDPNSYLISVGKLKVHDLTMVTLATKNLFGLPSLEQYRIPSTLSRFALHNRSFHQAIVDVSLARPIDFAVVDGIWGLEGTGPWGGIPRQMDLVVAGDNSVAVDRVCTWAMGIPSAKVLHLSLASAKGLGPAGLEQISVQGDSFEPVSFLMPAELPLVTPPKAVPYLFNPSINETVEIRFRVSVACRSLVELVQVSSFDNTITQICLVQDWQEQPAGLTVVEWDGRNNEGQIVPAYSYGIRVSTQRYEDDFLVHFFGWVVVQSSNSS